MSQETEADSAGVNFAAPTPKEFSREFLQTVMDALPEAIVVIDRSYNIVMANQAAQKHKTCLKCYQCFHRQLEPCDNSICPVQQVVETKFPTRVYHTHYGEDDREISVAIDAAPIFDENGEIEYMVEACRDVTERSLARRLSRIGNCHMTLGPLLAEYAMELRKYTRCSQVHIHVLDEKCAICGASNGNGAQHKSDPSARYFDSICVRDLSVRCASEMSPATDAGSFRFDHFSEYLSNLPDAIQERLAACVWRNCESVALVPIRYGESQIGLLNVGDPHPEMMPSDMLESLERLSTELGAAIHRVRIEEALQTARGELEKRVRERTEELTRTNESLHKEIIERGKLERQLVRATVKEQQRIGQELHDGLGQELTGISYMAQNLVMRLRQSGSSELQAAEELARGIRAVIGQTQKIVRGLVPLEIDSSDLVPALQHLTLSMSKQTGMECEFEADTEASSGLDEAEAIHIYRIAQEAITNAVKHAQARQVVVSLKQEEEAVCLEVVDDGVGFGMDVGDSMGCGLRSMRYRARAIGGQFEIAERPEGGTRVMCRVARK